MVCHDGFWVGAFEWKAFQLEACSILKTWTKARIHEGGYGRMLQENEAQYENLAVY